MAEDISERSSLKRFGARLRFHLDRGTRPDGKTKRWSFKEFGGAVHRSGTTVSSWCDGSHLPPRFGPIEFALFGENPPDDDDNYRAWRLELQKLFREAVDGAADKGVLPKSESAGERGPSTSSPTISGDATGRKNPIVHWQHTDSDKIRNEYLDEEPAPVDFFVSVGTFAHAGSHITLRMRYRPGPRLKLKSITLVRLHPKVVKRLTTAKLLDDDFEQLLQNRIKMFVAEVGKDPRNIRIVVRFWSDMPSFHGYLFSNRRFTNQWAFEKGKLHVDVPLLEYPSPDWDDETHEAIRTMSNCELDAEYLNGKRLNP
jgi:hypothetical protein